MARKLKAYQTSLRLYDPAIVAATTVHPTTPGFWLVAAYNAQCIRRFPGHGVVVTVPTAFSLQSQKIFCGSP